MALLPPEDVVLLARSRSQWEPLGCARILRLVKRDVQLEDSGLGIPSHGGLLDRFDTLIFLSVATYLVLTLVLGF